MSVVLAICYYLVPDVMFNIGPVPVRREIVLVLLFSIIAVMEILRLLRIWNLSLFRKYERNRISAPFWFSSTTALLVLLTPQWFAVPIFLGVTFGDPLIGELRNRGVRLYPLFGWLACLPAYLLFSYPIYTAMLLGGTAVLVEVIKVPIKNKNSVFFTTGISDDNFTMQFFPSLLLLLLYFLGVNFGMNWLLPDGVVLLKPLY